MSKKTRGFTLVELIISMAVYAILLIILSVIVLLFARLLDTVNNPDSLHYQKTKLETFMINTFNANNDQISFSELGDPNILFTIGVASDDSSVVFSPDDNALLYGGRLISSHPEFESMEVEVLSQIVVFTLKNAQSEIISKIILKYPGGNP
jgi:prepilin-type N-terminal cleavage/methylation domain-containing protein